MCNCACRHADKFMYAHVMPQAVCLLAQGSLAGQGQLAVDFVARLEHLEEDWPLLEGLINARRGPGLPALHVPGEALGGQHCALCASH